MSTNLNLEAALRLARAGLPVFPCDPVSKAPLVNRWASVATTTERGVLYFWQRYGLDSMPGIASKQTRLVPVDLDRKHGKDGVAAFDALLDQYGELPRCPVTKTPNNGYHLIFNQPGAHTPLGLRSGGLPAGIDVRGCNGTNDGGFVIGPGAVMSTGEFYEPVAGWPDLCEAFAAGTIPEIPAWLVELIESRPDGSGPRLEPRAKASGDKSQWVASALEFEAIELARLSEGSRNNELNRITYRPTDGPHAMRFTTHAIGHAQRTAI
jgi:hypothetical protein